MIDFQNMSLEEFNLLENERQKKLSGLAIAESPSSNPLINELRYNYGFYQIGPFLINDSYDKLELATIDIESLLFLHFIGVKNKQVGRGTEIMKLMCKLADKYDYEIQLKVDEKQGTPKKVLEKFYRKFGFEYSDEEYLEMTRKIMKL